MTFTIGPECIDMMDQTCTEVCPVECIYVGERKLYINRDECIDCGACEPACPQKAIRRVEDVTDPEHVAFAEDEVRFFGEVLPGREEPIGSPGSSSEVGPVGVDTEMVANSPRKDD